MNRCALNKSTVSMRDDFRLAGQVERPRLPVRVCDEGGGELSHNFSFSALSTKMSLFSRPVMMSSIPYSPTPSLSHSHSLHHCLISFHHRPHTPSAPSFHLLPHSSTHSFSRSPSSLHRVPIPSPIISCPHTPTTDPPTPTIDPPSRFSCVL
jgi:hypothetical protein